MQDRNASRAVVPNRREVGIAPIRLAWNRGAGWERVRRHVRATTSHPRLGEVILTGITFVLVALLLATVHHAVEAPRPPAGFVFGIGPH